MRNSVTFVWPETTSGSNASFTCPNNRLFAVNRFCQEDGQWGDFNDEGCGVLASELEDIATASQNVIWNNFCRFLAT